jgi:predicted MPP superfamily phosphohydrolase
VFRLARYIFPYAWEVVALAGALGTWLVGCWTWGAPANPAVHLVAVAALWGTLRLAADGYELEDSQAPIRHRTGGLLLASGFVAAGGVAGLVLAGIAWVLVVRAGGLAAQAGTAGGVATTWLGGEFRVVGWLGVLAGMGLVLDGYLLGHRRTMTTRLDVALPHLPLRLDGFRIVQVSDLHVGPLTSRAALRDAIDRVLAEDPDLVVVTGDLVDSPRTRIADWLPDLRRLRARHGVVAILGNHDAVHGLDRVDDALRAGTDWVVLRDRIHVVDGVLHVLGLEYRPPGFEGDGLEAAAAGLPPDAPVVVLAHIPNAFREAARLRLPLVLAGHTHGGQFAVPGVPSWNVARLLMTKWDAGTFASGPSLLHVNRGLGTSAQRIRIGAPREITVVTLRSPDATRDE